MMNCKYIATQTVNKQLFNYNLAMNLYTPLNTRSCRTYCIKCLNKRGKHSVKKRLIHVVLQQ